MVDNLRFFAGAARCLEGRAAGEYMRGYTSMLRREPVGVVGQIAPWNYPLMMAIWKIGPALAAGNTVVLKPSEQTPLTAFRLAQLAAEHLPKGVLNVIFGHGEPAGAGIVRHPEVAMVSLTGDVATGKEVARAAADSLKRVHLELGGKAPVIVFDDADLEAVVEGVKVAGYFNAGQDCTAATRVLAGPKIHDDFVSGIAEAAQLAEGRRPAPKATPSWGRSSRRRSASASSGFLGRAPGHAETVTGGKAPDRRGLLPGADGRRGSGARGRDDPARGLRARRDRAAVLVGRGGARVGERRRLRAGGQRLDARRRPRDERSRRAALRHRLDQRPHSARFGDAARWLQAVRLWQGHVDLLAGGLHGDQARDGQPDVAPGGRRRRLDAVRRELHRGAPTASEGG